MLLHGPPTATNFFYDMVLEPGRVAKESDWPALEANAKRFSKEKQLFDHLEVSKEDLQKLFEYSKYKMPFVETFIPNGGPSTVYCNNALVDLCLGPHILHTKQISAIKIVKNSCLFPWRSRKQFSAARLWCSISQSPANEKMIAMFKRGKGSRPPGNWKAAKAFLLQPTLSCIPFSLTPLTGLTRVCKF